MTHALGPLNISQAVTPMPPDPNGAKANANGKTVATETVDPDAKPDNGSEDPVHLGYYCDGDGCVTKGLESIVGARYECVSCHKHKYLHNLCAICYDKYPFKAMSANDILPQESRESTTATSVSSAEIHPTVVAPSDRSKVPDSMTEDSPAVSAQYRSIISGNHIEHDFCRIEQCVASEEAEDCKRSHRPIGKDSTKAKVAFLRQFDHMNFVLGILVLYPVGLFNYLINRCVGRWVKSQRGSNVKAKVWLYRLLWPSIQYDEYFAKFRFMHIGICLIWNAATIWGIIRNAQVNGAAWAWYWIVSWEVIFVQILSTQAQLHARRDKVEDIVDFIGYIFRDLVCEVGLGLSFFGHYVVYVLDRSKVSHFCDYQCRIQRKQSNVMFWFPLPSVVCKDARDDNFGGQRHCRVHMTRSFRHVERHVESSDAGYGSLLATVCVVLCTTLFITIISSDSRTMINALGNAAHLPHVTYYTIIDSSIVPVCLTSSDSEMARLHLSLHLDPMPTVVSGLPTFSMGFNYINSTTLSTALNCSLEQLWYASLVNTTPHSINFQLQPNHDFLAAIVSTPDVLCSAVSEIQLWSPSIHAWFAAFSA